MAGCVTITYSRKSGGGNGGRYHGQEDLPPFYEKQPTARIYLPTLSGYWASYIYVSGFQCVARADTRSAESPPPSQSAGYLCLRVPSSIACKSVWTIIGPSNPLSHHLYYLRTSRLDTAFVISHYKREGVDTKTLPAIDVGVPEAASESEKQHYVGFCKYLSHGLQGKSLPKYAEIRLPQSRNLCVWLCPPSDSSAFEATDKLKLLIPPVLLSSFTFSPPSSPLPSPVSSGNANSIVEEGGSLDTLHHAGAATDDNTTGMQKRVPVRQHFEGAELESDETPRTSGEPLSLPAAVGTRARIPPPVAPSYVSHPSSSPPRPVDPSMPASTFMAIDNSYLSTLSQNHVWLFGALAELLHNSLDAGSTRLHIDVREEDGGEGGVMVLEIKDNGVGMGPDEMEGMFRLGKTYARDRKNVERVGRYGCGFKQGSLRIGSTAVVLSKSLRHKSLVMGILSNEPHLRDENAAPVCRVVTLSPDTMEPDPLYTSRQAFREASELIARYSFVTPERHWSLLLNAWAAGESGTVVYIQGMERGDPEGGGVWRELRVDRAEGDLQLVTRTGKKHLNTRGALLAHDVPIDYSLRAYLQVAFLQHRMRITLLGKDVPTPDLLETLLHVRRYNLLQDEPTRKPVIASVGFSSEAKRLGLGGAMFFCTNVLIASYVRQEIGITNPREGMGVLAVVHLDPRHYETQHSKQSFRRPNPALEKIEERLGRVWTQYISQELAREARIGKSKAVEIPSRAKLKVTDFIQCEHCGKWRMVTQSYVMQFAGKDTKWYCWSQGSPVTSCEAPEAAISQEGEEVMVDFKTGSQAEYLTAIVDGGEMSYADKMPGKRKHGPTSNKCGSQGKGQSVEDSRERERKSKGEKSRTKKKHHGLDLDQKVEGVQKKRRKKCHRDDYSDGKDGAGRKPRFLISGNDTTLLKPLSLPHLNLVKLSDGRKVVLKNVAVSPVPEARSAFREELKKLRRLNHENLVPVVAARIEEGKALSAVGFAFEEALVDLDHVLLKPHSLVTLEDRLLTACKIAAGLDYLHAHGLVHGALRPANILVSFPMPMLQVVKLTDQGITHRGLSKGVPSRCGSADRITFTAPERLSIWSSSMATAEARSRSQSKTLPPLVLHPSGDIWSMGVLLLELMVGRKAWGAARDPKELRRLVADFSIAEFSGWRIFENFKSRLPADSGWEERLNGIKQILQACLRRKASERLGSHQLVNKLAVLSADILYRPARGP